MDAWSDVESNDDKNVINGTWASKCKQFPNGTVKKFKASFCACGNQQLEGIYFLRLMPLLSNGLLFFYAYP